jgi:diacylglycerol kinase family enzyme
VSDDGLFDVKLVREAPLLAYPFLFTVMLTGQYDLSRNTMTFRATQLELLPDARCRFETDGDLVPHQPCYRIQVAGRIRLIVPASPPLVSPLTATYPSRGTPRG